MECEELELELEFVLVFGFFLFKNDFFFGVKFIYDKGKYFFVRLMDYIKYFL